VKTILVSLVSLAISAGMVISALAHGAGGGGNGGGGNGGGHGGGGDGSVSVGHGMSQGFGHSNNSNIVSSRGSPLTQPLEGRNQSQRPV
jgi:hypothetical protein